MVEYRTAMEVFILAQVYHAGKIVPPNVMLKPVGAVGLFVIPKSIKRLLTWVFYFEGMEVMADMGVMEDTVDMEVTEVLGDMDMEEVSLIQVCMIVMILVMHIIILQEFVTLLLL